MAELYLDSEEVRYILQNSGKIKREGKCIHCGGTGWLNWDGSTGDDVKFGRLSNYENDRLEEECEKCEGVGFVW